MIDTTNRAQLIERELSSDHGVRHEHAVAAALETAKTADPELRARLARLYAANSELLRLRAARVEAERAFRTAHQAWDALNNTIRGGGQDGKLRDLEAAGVAALEPWRFDQVDDPAELRQGAEQYARLAGAAGA